MIKEILQLLIISCVPAFTCMSQTNAVLRVNLPVEEHASKIYTRAMFEQFGHNLYQAGAYRVEEVEKGKLYLAKHTKPHRREKWTRVVFEVKVLDDGELFECECGLFEHMGIVCLRPVHETSSPSCTVCSCRRSGPGNLLCKRAL
jgi:hypothetical protein